MSFTEAKKAAGLDVASPRSLPRLPRREAARKLEASASSEAPGTWPGSWQDKATNFARACYTELMLAEQPVRDVLLRRGLPQGAWQTYLLGWNPAGGDTHLIRPRKVWGLPDAPPKKAGDKPKTGLWLPRGIVIPQLTGGDGLSGGRVQRLRIRRPEADRETTGLATPYYVVPGSGMAPLWLPQRPGVLPPGSCCLVVESELDALAVHWHAGDLGAVIGIMTANVRTLPAEILLRLRECARILVATDYGDPDRAGARGWEIWRDTFPQARRWPCVGGCKDPGKMFEAGLDVRAWIVAGLPESLGRLALGKPISPEERPQLSGSYAGAQPPAPPEERFACRPDTALATSPEARAVYPLRCVYHQADTALRSLRAHRLRAVPTPDGLDYRIQGWERLSLSERGDLLYFMRYNSELVLRALAEAQ